MSLSDDIKALAYDVGFHRVGIAVADPFTQSSETLTERLNDGMLDGTGINAGRIRQYAKPQDSLPGAKSIISAALSYLTEDDLSPHSKPGLRGWMARFSRGADYHRELDHRLQSLSESMRARLGVNAEMRQYADTGPISDRSAAIRAGTGIQGKNGCIYSGDYGSWVALGEIVTDAELEPDHAPALDICGNCRNCIEACPTGALSAPNTVDARICLSRVTQAKGFIPLEMRPKLGTRIYGCDTCQEACPLNKGASPGNIEAFRWSAGLGGNPELLPLINISAGEFRKHVGPTTAGWIRRTRIRRNAVIAAGNAGDPAVLGELVASMADPEPIIRGHAAWALGQIGAGQARAALEKALPAEDDPQAAAEIRLALETGQGGTAFSG